MVEERTRSNGEEAVGVGARSEEIGEGFHQEAGEEEGRIIPSQRRPLWALVRNDGRLFIWQVLFAFRSMHEPIR